MAAFLTAVLYRTALILLKAAARDIYSNSLNEIQDSFI
jgi:hypothetical protein